MNKVFLMVKDYLLEVKKEEYNLGIPVSDCRPGTFIARTYYRNYYGQDSPRQEVGVFEVKCVLHNPEIQETQIFVELVEHLLADFDPFATLMDYGS